MIYKGVFESRKIMNGYRERKSEGILEIYMWIRKERPL